MGLTECREYVLGFAAVGQVLFVLLYSQAPWWKTFLGRVLFFKAVALASVMIVVVIGLRRDWAHEQTTLLVLYGLLAVAIWAQVVAFIRTMRRGRVSGNGGQG